MALPLDEINAEAAREKSIRHGHPSTLHLWWARRPLAAARAVLFAQLVNDPGGTRGWKAGLTKEDAKKKRDELFEIIRDLVVWENVNNEAVLDRAREAVKNADTRIGTTGKGIGPAYEDKVARRALRVYDLFYFVYNNHTLQYLLKYHKLYIQVFRLLNFHLLFFVSVSYLALYFSLKSTYLLVYL